MRTRIIFVIPRNNFEVARRFSQTFHCPRNISLVGVTFHDKFIVTRRPLGRSTLDVQQIHFVILIKYLQFKIFFIIQKIKLCVNSHRKSWVLLPMLRLLLSRRRWLPYFYGNLSLLWCSFLLAWGWAAKNALKKLPFVNIKKIYFSYNILRSSRSIVDNRDRFVV